MDARRRQLMRAGTGLLLASSWHLPAVAAATAPVLAVIDIDTPGARKAYEAFAAAVERRFAAARAKPQVRFVLAGEVVNEQNTRMLGDALRAIRPDIVLASNQALTQMVVDLNIGKPIIFFSTIDPVAEGLTDSLTRPNKGMTGFTLGTGSARKRREMLLRLAPRCRILGLLSNTTHRNEGVRQAPAAELDVLPGVEQRRFGCDDLEQLAALLKTPAARKVDAWDIEYSYVPFRFPEETIRQFDTLRRPVIYPRMKHIRLGGMAAYEPKIDEADDAWVSQVASLLAGVPIENIPVVQATRYSFGLNLKACRRVGIEPPKSLIRIADVVIE